MAVERFHSTKRQSNTKQVVGTKNRKRTKQYNNARCTAATNSSHQQWEWFILARGVDAACRVLGAATHKVARRWYFVHSHQRSSIGMSTKSLRVTSSLTGVSWPLLGGDTVGSRCRPHGRHQSKNKDKRAGVPGGPQTRAGHVAACLIFFSRQFPPCDQTGCYPHTNNVVKTIQYHFLEVS